MHRLYLLCFFFLCTFSGSLKAQPGFVMIGGQLNYISAALIDSYLAAETHGSYRLFTIDIDSTTRLDRLSVLRRCYSLSLNIRLDVLPPQFCDSNLLNLEDISLVNVRSSTFNISNLKNLSRLRSLVLDGYSPDALPEGLAKLGNLHSLQVRGSNLRKVPELARLKNLEELTLGCTNLRALPVFARGNKLRSLTLMNPGPDFNYRSLCSLRNLERLIIYDGALTEFPAKLSPRLNELRLVNCDSLRNADALGLYPQLRRICIVHSGLSRFDAPLRCDTLQELTLQNMPQLRSIAAVRFLRSIRELQLIRLPQLPYLSLDTLCRIEKAYIEELPALRDADTLLSAPGLGAVELRKTGIRHIPGPEVRIRIPQLLIYHNPLLQLPDETILKPGTRHSILMNGRP